MSNLVLNSGFETGTAPWQLLGQATRRSDLGVHAGSWALRLSGIYSSVGPGQTGTATQGALATVIGKSYPISMWVNADVQSGSVLIPMTVPLEVAVDPAGGSSFTVLGTLAGRAAVPTGWSLWSVGSFVATSTAAKLRIRALVPASGLGTWLVDDVNLPSSTLNLNDSVSAQLRVVELAPDWSTTSIVFESGDSQAYLAADRRLREWKVEWPNLGAADFSTLDTFYNDRRGASERLYFNDPILGDLAVPVRFKPDSFQVAPGFGSTRSVTATLEEVLD